MSYDQLMGLTDDDDIGGFEKSLPVDGDLHINQALSNVAIAWKQEASRFVAGKVFPEVPVQKQSDSFYVWEIGDFFRNEAEEQGGNTAAPEMNLRLSPSNYHCKVIHIGGKITELDQINQDPAINKEMAIARAIAMKLLIKRESTWIAKFFVASKWQGSFTGTADRQGVAAGANDTAVKFVQLDDFAASDPIALLRPEIAFLIRLGVNPDDIVLTVGNDVWFKGIVDHPKFLERYENTQAAIINEQLVAAVLGIREVLVCYASSNTAGETKTASVSYMAGKHMLLSVSPKAPSKEMPSAGYTFNLAALQGAGEDAIRIRRFPVNDPPGMKQVGDMGYDQVLTSTICAVFFKDAVS